jgi:hypothetical protein
MMAYRVAVESQVLSLGTTVERAEDVTRLLAIAGKSERAVGRAIPRVRLVLSGSAARRSTAD